MKQSNSIKKFYLALFFPAILQITCTLLFVASPENFYYRPWEYFSDISYKTVTYNAYWDGYESSDLTRKTLLCRQEKTKTKVSVDRNGFRRAAPHQESFKILVSGDSQIYGSGLSDHETLPWKLSKKLQTPVFNGGRTALDNVINNPELRDVTVILDATTERDVKPNNFSIQEQSTFHPIMTNDASFVDTIRAVPLEKYSIPSILGRSIDRFKNDIRMMKKDDCNPDYAFLAHKMFPDELEATVKSIKFRSNKYTAKGYRYIFVAIPSKQTLYDDSVDSYTKNYIYELTLKLIEHDVETINLAEPFITSKNLGLYKKYDTHWNSNGTELAAKVISEYMKFHPHGI